MRTWFFIALLCFATLSAYAARRENIKMYLAWNAGNRYRGMMWLLLSLLASAAIGSRASVTDDTDLLPMNLSGDEVAATVNNVQDHLFFVNAMAFDHELRVECDSFLLPNESTLQMTVTWRQLIDASGANILRKPTVRELNTDGIPLNWETIIYTTKRNPKPAYATGIMQLRIPVKYAHVVFHANEINMPRRDGPLNLTLQRCKGGSLTLLQHGKLADDNYTIITHDAEGRRLPLEYAEENISNTKIDYSAVGIIAKVEVYFPIAYYSRTINVRASVEPNMFATPRVVTTARYAQAGASVKDADFDIDSLQAQTKVVAQRDYAVAGYNTPTIVIKLPKVLNSAYASVEFGKPVLTDAHGKTVNYTPLNGIFELATFTNFFQFLETKIPFAFASGTVHIRYPAKLKIVTLTPAQPNAGTVQARFHGPLVKINAPDGAAPFLPDNLAFASAIDASGRLLKHINFEGSEMVGKTNWYSYAFWGKPAQVRVVTVVKWLTLDVPYHLPPAAMLPKNKAGEDPEDYQR